MNFGKSVQLALDFSEPVPEVKEAFATQGFGILAEIDVQATLQAPPALRSRPVLLGEVRSLSYRLGHLSRRPHNAL